MTRSLLYIFVWLKFKSKAWTTDKYNIFLMIFSSPYSALFYEICFLCFYGNGTYLLNCYSCKKIVFYSVCAYESLSRVGIHSLFFASNFVFKENCLLCFFSFSWFLQLSHISLQLLSESRVKKWIILFENCMLDCFCTFIAM